MYAQKDIRKAIVHMKKIIHTKAMRTVLSAFLAAAMLLGVVPVQGVRAAASQETSMAASYIQKMENAPAVDLETYADSSVMFRLSDNIREDEEISVIITVDAPNLMDAYEGTDKTMSFTDFALESEEAAAIEKQIASEKARILAVLDEQGVACTAGADYSVLTAGFEIEILAKDYDLVCMSLGEGEKATVSEVYRTMETQLVENTVNVYDTGIFKSGDSGYDGTGTVVAVLDTGLDSNHTAFSVENFTSDNLALTYEDVAKVIKQTKAYELSGSLSVDDVYINEKVPFGYDYADNDPDPYSTHNNHGTHVSGVITGIDDTITGVAPNSQLVTMKVFSDVMDTARASWILDALEDCVVLGVDVINMSLGTACGFAREGEEELEYGVYEKIRKAGISMVVAASNSYNSAYGSEKNGNLGLTSNPDTGTVGSPGTYDGVMSVASINGVETPYLLYGETIMYFDESNTGAAEENHFVDTLLGDKDTQEFEYITIPGVGRSADYTGLDLSGKIALVRRGDNTFEEKALIAEAQGAAGIIIYNNVSGEIKMNVGDAKLATCSISQDDGELLAAKETGKLKISKDQTSGPFISDFSSWGPTPSLEIKPEITAHGGNILSSVTGGGYDRLSGTSMACPNLAGVTLLMRQYVMENFPDIANDDVAVNAMANRLMMSTADIIINTNGQPYAVRKQGAGLANLLNSINTTACIITKDEDGKEMDKTKLELGDDADKTGVYTMSFTVDNFGDKNLTYSNVFYGANFVDYVGSVEDKLTMVRPVNGEGYDSYIYGQYFDMAIDGAQAADKTTLAAINAIKALPERVGYEDKALVEAARAAYTKIATTMQQAQVFNYADLISAEQRITALTPAEETEGGEAAESTEATEAEQKSEPAEKSGNGGTIALIAILAVVLGGSAGWFFLKKRKTAAAPAEAETVAEPDLTEAETAEQTEE